MKKRKFTYKTRKPVGRFKWLMKTSVDIYLDGFQVGGFDDGDMRVRFMVIKDDINEDGNPNCIWKNIFIKINCPTIEETKEYLNINIDNILSNFNLRKE